MFQELNYEINNPFPLYSELSIHELDNYICDIYFFIDGQKFPVDLSSGSHQTVKINITINNFIIAEEQQGIAIPDDNTGLRFNLTLKQLRQHNISIFPGLMKVEFIIQDNASDPTRTFCPLAPLEIKISPSILDRAEINPESVGSVADAVKQINDAIGDAESLADVIEAKLDDVDDVIQSNHIASGAVTSGKLASGAVTSGKIASGAVTSGKIGNGEVKQANLANSSVTGSAINNGAVTTEKVADGAVTSGKLASGAVTSGKIATEAVTNAKLASNAVNTNEIVDAAVTNAKLANGSVNAAKITDGSVITSKINDSAVTTAKINDGAVTTEKIADGAVATGKLAASAATTEKIADAAITEAKISNTSISTAKLKDGAVTSDKLSSGLASDLSDVNTALNGASGLMSYKNLETISEASALDGINRIGNRVWEFIATGSLASAIGITNPSHCSMTAVFCDGTWYQIITVLPSLAQYVRKVNTVYPNWSADSWVSSSLLTRISALESTVGTVNSVLQAIVDGGASNE